MPCPLVDFAIKYGSFLLEVSRSYLVSFVLDFIYRQDSTLGTGCVKFWFAGQYLPNKSLIPAPTIPAPWITPPITTRIG